MKKQLRFIFLSLVTAVVTASSSFAALLNVNIAYPRVTFNNFSLTGLSYNASSHLFSVSASLQVMTFSSSGGSVPVTGTSSIKILALVDNTGALIGSGGPGNNDLVLSGTVTNIVGNVTNTYSGVLLTGIVTQFGFQAAQGPSGQSQFELRFVPTGGALSSLINCGVAVHINSSLTTFNGSFAVSFKGQAQGACGVEDTTPPQITCPPDITVECQAFASGIPGAFVSFPTPVVTDPCDAYPTVTCTPPSGSFFPLLPWGVQTTNYTVVCVAADGAGNTNICTFVITVEDTLPPEFADTNNPLINSDLNQPLWLTNDPGQCHATFMFATPLATDNSYFTIFDTTVSAIDENGATIPLTDLGNGLLQGQFPLTLTGSNVVTVTANDGHGNTAQHQTAIFVADTQPPGINCPGDQTVECTNGPVFFEEPVVFDNCPNVTLVCVPPSGSLLSLGSHQIVCTVTDCSGNTNQCTFTVTVQDTNPPVISCPTNVMVECGQSTDPASTGMAAATDNCDTTPTVTFTDAISGNCPQTITRTWTATDYSGNSNSCIQIITVTDTTPPAISCPPDKQLQCGDSTNPANTGTATATDNCSTTVSITFTDVATPANCTGNAGIDRTWKATDACGNSSTCVQHITFVDTTAPVISSVPAGGNLGCNPANLPTDASVKALVTATDNSGSVTVSVKHVDGGTACAPTRTFTITATDGCGNASSPSTVVYTWTADTIPPVISSVPTGANLGCNPANPPMDASVKAQVAATDNCGAPSINVTHMDATSGCAVTRTFTITATDGCGNTSAAKTVVYTWTADTAPPKIICPANISVSNLSVATTNYTGVATATDNCDANPVVSYTDSVSNSCGSVIARTWKATDACGNSSSCVQIITIPGTGSIMRLCVFGL